MNTNVCVFTGRVVAQAETKIVNANFQVTTFSLAINERVKSDKTESGYADRPNFLDMAIFGRYGEVLRPALSKGREITVTCRAHQDRWEKDGKGFQKVVFYVDNVVVQREGKAGREAASPSSGSSASFDNVPPEVQAAAAALGGTIEGDLTF